MTSFSSLAIISVLASAGLAQADDMLMQGLHRTDIVKNDISVPGKEVLQVRVDFPAHAVSIKHKHPGEEIAFVLEGTLEYQLEGKQPVILKAGQSLFIPSGTAHVARNVGQGNASELATYVVAKDADLLVPVQ